MNKNIIKFPNNKQRTDDTKYVEYNIDTVDENDVLEDGEEAWRCNCGSVVFFLTRLGAKCHQCGIISNDWVED